MSTSSKSMLMVALEAAAQGFRVLPVSPESKKPLVKEWTDVATTDSHQISVWWRQFPNAMVGVATGGAHE